MDRLKRDAVLLSLIQQLHMKDSWCGETHIQKSTYFLQELLSVPLDFEFILYKHGPFSFDLSDEITAMRANQMLKLVPQEPYGPRILLDEGGKMIVKRFPTIISNYTYQVSFVADKMASKGVAELERRATALYVTNEDFPSEDVESRAHRIHELKPHVSFKEALSAIEWLDDIKRELEDANIAAA